MNYIEKRGYTIIRVHIVELQEIADGKDSTCVPDIKLNDDDVGLCRIPGFSHCDCDVVGIGRGACALLLLPAFYMSGKRMRNASHNLRACPYILNTPVKWGHWCSF